MTKWQRCRDPKVAWLALKVALFIGTVLNLIHHYDLFLGAPLERVTVIQMCLTYVVPVLRLDARPGLRPQDFLSSLCAKGARTPAG